MIENWEGNEYYPAGNLIFTNYGGDHTNYMLQEHIFEVNGYYTHPDAPSVQINAYRAAGFWWDASDKTLLPQIVDITNCICEINNGNYPPTAEGFQEGTTQWWEQDFGTKFDVPIYCYDHRTPEDAMWVMPIPWEIILGEGNPNTAPSEWTVNKVPEKDVTLNNNNQITNSFGFTYWSNAMRRIEDKGGPSFHIALHLTQNILSENESPWINNRMIWGKMLINIIQIYPTGPPEFVFGSEWGGCAKLPKHAHRKPHVRGDAVEAVLGKHH